MADKKMDNLASGSLLGHYRILEKLGAGGMGEVYLAQDTRLERKVALKILPADVAQNTERMRRFVQEAKAASSLNHPNIAHIYEIGAEGDTNFIAMEYVEGTTLREKIHGEKNDLRTLLKYLAQVADGLAKAHAAGIVHRDLKPDNVMISADGYAKILDFGLAKLLEMPKSPGANDSDTANEAETAMMSPQLSAPGMIMGTAGYMSPEQAKGKPEIDQRSDIFSFGCVLFEAATGRQPFAGDSAIDTLHKIINAPAPPVRDFNPLAPADLQRIVRRCLQKDVDERFQSIKDVSIELKELRREMRTDAEQEYSAAPQTQGSDSGSDENATQISTENQSANQTAAIKTNEASVIHSTSSAEYIAGEIKRHKRGLAIISVLLLLAAAGIGAWFYKSSKGEEKKTGAISLQSAKLARLTNTGKVVGIAISPDGKYVAHVMEDGGQQSLWIRQTATTSNVQIVPPSDAAYRGLAFSPDGNYLYYSVREKNDLRGILYQVPSLGGTSRKLLTGIATSLAFSPDGKQMAFFRTSLVEGAREDALMIANADGTGERTLATRRANERFHRGAFSSLSWSPDGKTIACSVSNIVENYYTIATVSTETGEVKILTPPRWFAVRQVAWLADGSSILFNANENSELPYQIWQFFIATGEIKRVTNDLINYQQFNLTANSDALAVLQSEGTANIWAMPAAGDTSRATQITSDRNFNSDLTWTPDGRIIYASNASNGLNFYLTDLSGGIPKQLTNASGANRYPTVTRDGRYIVFMSGRTGRPHIWKMDIDGGNQKQLTDGFDLYPYVSPDGQWIFYQSWTGKTTLRKVSIEGGAPIELTDYICAKPAISPDGKQIACVYQENLGAPVKLAILSSEGGAPLKTFQAEIESDTNIRWTTDGKEIVFSATEKGVSNLWTQPVDGGKPRQLTNFKSDRIFWFDFSHDSKQLALSRGLIIGDVVLISNFK